METLDRAGFDLTVTLQGDGAGAQLLTPIADQFLDNPMLKMLPLVLLMLHAWLRQGDRTSGSGVLASAESVVRGTLAIGAALAAGRILQKLLPMRLRPRFTHPEIPFPPTDFAISLDDWSSMPSDHAMLVAAIVTVIWTRSRWHALLGAAWGLALICLSRVYFGLHYVSDILVGFGLGLALAYAVLRVPLPAITWDWLRRLDERRPALVVLGLFILSWAVGENFASLRTMILVIRTTVSAYLINHS
jgi:membrane-associated phospholipid phosphatase